MVKIKSDSHETWKCVDPELEWQIRCFPYGERSNVPRLQQVEQKAVGRQRNLGLNIYLPFSFLSGMARLRLFGHKHLLQIIDSKVLI
jgi:hypothetical protein